MQNIGETAIGYVTQAVKLLDKKLENLARAIPMEYASLETAILFASIILAAILTYYALIITLCLMAINLNEIHEERQRQNLRQPTSNQHKGHPVLDLALMIFYIAGVIISPIVLLGAMIIYVVAKYNSDETFKKDIDQLQTSSVKAYNDWTQKSSSSVVASQDLPHSNSRVSTVN